MSSVDSRIVTMKFENSQFQKGVSSTLSALANLKNGLAKLGGGKELADINAAAGRVNLSPVAEQAHGVSKAFVAMSTIAITAISQMTSAVTSQVGGMAKSLTGVKAMADGWSDYELKIGATQTIMAGTGASIGQVSKQLKELDVYADKTIYSLSDMTTNIGKFTNAGVKLPVAVNALKGVAQVAALSGANAGEAGRAMYNLGQAIGQGTVRLIDWKSVEIANMGTKEFKEQLIDAAVAMGTLKKASDGSVTSLKGNEVNYKTFNGTLQDQWLTSKVLTTTLGKYADETTAIGKKATKAATEVKTFSMMIETLAAAAGTGWTDTFEIIFGNLPQATKLWTGITDAIGGFIGKQADARNNMLQGWKDLGGRKDLIEGFKNVFEAFGAILKPIGKAFREVFPPSTGEGLAKLTEGFRNFTESLIISKDASKAIGSIFKVVFTLLGVGVDIVQGLVKSFFALASQIGSTLGPPITNLINSIGGLVSKLGGLMGFKVDLDSLFDGLIKARTIALQPILDFIARMINALASLIDIGGDNLVANLQKGFSGLQPTLEKVAAGFEKVKTFAKDLFTSISGALDFGGSAEKAAGEVTVLGAAMGAAKSVIEAIKSAWDGLKRAFSGTGGALSGAGEGIIGWLSSIKDRISGFISDFSFEEILAIINTGFFIMLYRSFKKFTSQLGDVAKSASKVLDQVSSNLKTMQADVKADVILKIAGALMLLAAALWVLAGIPAMDLAKALGAAAIGIWLMTKALEKLESTAKKNWKDAARSSANMITMSVALLALSLAMVAFAGAIKVLSTMSVAELTKGLTAFAVILAAVVGASTILEKSGGARQILIASAAIAVLAVALTMFAGTIKLYSSLDLGMMAEGVAKLSGAMIALGIAFQFFPKNMFATAAGLMVASIALTAIAGVMKIFGGFSVEEMVKSLIMLAGALTIISFALILMSGTVSGSAAILVFAAAMALLVPSLLALGSMDLSTLGMALLALVGIFTVLGLAGLILAPVVPVIAALAIAIGLLGIAALAVGAGLMLFATGLAMLAASGAAGFAVLTAAVIAMAELIPLIAQQVGLGIIAIAKVIAKSGPPLTAAITTLLMSLINAIIKLAPKFGQMLVVMVSTGLKAIRQLFPQVIATGIALILAFLTAVGNNIGKIVKQATQLIVNFINAIGNNLPKIIDAGVKMAIKFINGVATAIENNTDPLIAAVLRVGTAVVTGMARGISASAGLIKDAALDAAKAAFDAVKGFFHISSPSKKMAELGKYVNQGFAKGIIGSKDEVIDAMNELTERLKDAMENMRSAVEDEQNKLSELLKAKNKDEKAIAESRKRLAEAKAEFSAAKSARDAFKNDMKDERAELVELSKQYDVITVKIEAAQKALDDAIKTRDDASKKIADQYGALPDITEETTVEDYTFMLEREASRTAAFLASLNQLVAMGLDDATYQKLLDEGVGIQPFVDELIKGGPDAVEAVDDATIDLKAAAENLGKTASTELYQAGVDSAQGLLNGLKSQKAALIKEMEEIAAIISKTVRKQLKIKSPSRVMAEIGRYTNEGLAQGLSKYSGVVEKASKGVGNTAIETLRATMSQISDAMNVDGDMNPVVSPVLDLTQLRKDASQIGSMMSSKALAAEVTYGQAASLSISKANARTASADAASTTETPTVVFEQNNYSPKALSHVEIYRATKSQISLAKEALTAP